MTFDAAAAKKVLAQIGPRGRRMSARDEEIDIDEMAKAAQIYALMALDICGRARSG